jgi:nucleotidyltransferase/DNA polymerase involved in DNA repair
MIPAIDESFLDVEHLPIRDRTAWAADLRATTKQWTGIPCSVGIGPTKTLAKLANKASKKLVAGYASGEGRLAVMVAFADAALLRTQLRAQQAVQHGAYDGYFGP